MGDDGVCTLGFLLFMIVLLPLGTVCLAIPTALVYGLLVALRSKLNVVLATVLPALSAAALVVILSWGLLTVLMWANGEAFSRSDVRELGTYAFMTFLLTFAVWFLAIASVLTPARLIGSLGRRAALLTFAAAVVTAPTLALLVLRALGGVRPLDFVLAVALFSIFSFMAFAYAVLFVEWLARRLGLPHQRGTGSAEKTSIAEDGLEY